MLKQKWHQIKPKIINFDMIFFKSQIRALFMKLWLTVHSRSKKTSRFVVVVVVVVVVVFGRCTITFSLLSKKIG